MQRAVLNRLVECSTLERENLLDSSHLYSSYVEMLETADDVDVASPYDAPIMDSYSMPPHGGSEAMLTMTGFTTTEFNVLWAVIDEHVMSTWNEGRGRRSLTTAKDAYFMMLSVMKHYDTWEKHALDFGIKSPTFEKLIGRIMSLATPVLYKHFVRGVAMAAQRAKNLKFEYFPEALYATDVKFQPANRPSGLFSEAKRYFSGKHKLYGYKIEASVALLGVYVDVSNHRPGSVSDLTIFMDRAAVHRAALAKRDDDVALEDNGEGHRLHPTSWAVLQDKGYEGVDEAVRSIRPKKKPRGGHLDRLDLDRNTRVSGDRVLVENMFGRTCLLWKISYATYKWSEEKFDMIQRLAFALTNYHVSLHPLRASDRDYYTMVMARYHSMAADKIDQANRRRRTHSERRRARIELDRAGMRGGQHGQSEFSQDF